MSVPRARIGVKERAKAFEGKFKVVCCDMFCSSLKRGVSLLFDFPH